MAEETKKPKIDLKARLGKTMVTSGSSGGAPVPLPVPGPAMPPVPAAPGSDPSAGDRVSGPPSSRPGPAIPPPAIPPPIGLSPGIPLPAFAPAVQAKPAAPAPQKLGAAAQTIKVEMGEEVQEQQKRAGRQKIVFAALGAVVGLGLGFVAGGQRETSKRSDAAVLGAKALEGDVVSATKKMEELSVLLDQGAEAIGAKKYPDDLSAGLASTQIPFDTNTLGGKNVGALPAKVLRAVLMFTKETEALNEKKDSLRNLLGAMKKPVEQAWADEKEPKFQFAVVFGGAPEKNFAELVRIKDPFKLQGDWPKEVPIMKREMVQGKKQEVEKKATRWLKGELTGGEQPPMLPVEPQSVAGFTSDQVVVQLRKAMIDIRLLLDGDKSDPQNETLGLIKTGQGLSAELDNLSKQK
jgi:hypothetical protein